MLASLRMLASPSANDTASKMRWPYSRSSVNLGQAREGGRKGVSKIRMGMRRACKNQEAHQYPVYLQITETAPTDLLDPALREVIVYNEDTGMMLNLPGHCRAASGL